MRGPIWLLGLLVAGVLAGCSKKSDSSKVDGAASADQQAVARPPRSASGLPPGMTAEMAATVYYFEPHHQADFSPDVKEKINAAAAIARQTTHDASSQLTAAADAAAKIAPLLTPEQIDAGAEGFKKALLIQKRARTGNRLHQLGSAIFSEYRKTHPTLPPDLGSLVNADHPMDQFLAVSDETVPPSGLTSAQQAQWVNENSDFVYALYGKHFAGDYWPYLLCWERAGIEAGGSNVMFPDGHVEFVKAEDLKPMIAETMRAVAKLH